MYSMAFILFPYINEHAKSLDIPLFKEKDKWAMFDIAKYHNDGKRQKINCEEHFDPGLLSLSLRSTQPGLQLKDENGKWIKPPFAKDIAILWTGDAAVKFNPTLKRGYHRVINGELNVPRIAMWHEICISSQEHKELISKPEPEKVIEREAKKQKVEYELDPKKQNIKIELDPKKFEGDSGIPMSKSMSPMSFMKEIKPINPINPFDKFQPYMPRESKLMNDIKPINPTGKFQPIMSYMPRESKLMNDIKPINPTGKFQSIMPYDPYNPYNSYKIK